MQYTSPRIMTQLKQKIYTAGITTGRNSFIYKEAVNLYNERKRVSCDTCIFLKNGTCTFLSNFDVVTKQEIYKPLTFYSDICKGYFWFHREQKQISPSCRNEHAF